MIRVTLTNSKLDKELGRKKEDFYGRFSIFKEETYCIFTAKHIIITFCKCSQQSLRFYPSSYFFLFYPERNSHLSHFPFGPCSDSNPILRADVARVKPPVR